MTRIYLDHNATTPMRPEVREALRGALERVAGNPSSLHRSGREARLQVDRSRERTAAALGVREDEIVFTSGGTESNNLALQGLLRPLGPSAGLAVSAVEHSSVLGAARALEREGHPLELVAVDGEGRLDLAALRAWIARAPRSGGRLLSTMAANNETGVLSPLEEIAAALRELREARRPASEGSIWPRWHVDAVQAFGKIPLRLEAWGADLASFSAHKVGGPPGVGVLYRRKGVPLDPLAHGGEQEGGLRAGTESVASIAAAGVAFELAARDQAALAEHLRALERELWDALSPALPGLRLLGPPLGSPRRLPGTLNLLMPGVDGKVLVTRLDLEGLEVSAGSACASGSLEPSHVLEAMGLDRESARAGLRVSLGRATTWKETRQAVETLRRSLGEIAAIHARHAGL